MANIRLTNISGRNLKGNTLGDIIKQGTHMFVFLRHLGCNLSQQLVDDIKKIEAKYKLEFPIIFVSQGTRAYGDIFWEKRYPNATVIFDASLTLAKNFGLKEGSIVQIFNPQSMFCSIKAMSNGNFPTGPKGNVFMLPGVFVYKDGNRTYSYISNTASDLPEFEELVKNYLIKEVSASANLPTS